MFFNSESELETLSNNTCVYFCFMTCSCSKYLILYYKQEVVQYTKVVLRYNQMYVIQRLDNIPLTDELINNYSPISLTVGNVSFTNALSISLVRVSQAFVQGTML